MLRSTLRTSALQRRNHQLEKTRRKKVQQLELENKLSRLYLFQGSGVHEQPPQAKSQWTHEYPLSPPFWVHFLQNTGSVYPKPLRTGPADAGSVILPTLCWFIMKWCSRCKGVTNKYNPIIDYTNGIHPAEPIRKSSLETPQAQPGQLPPPHPRPRPPRTIKSTITATRHRTNQYLPLFLSPETQRNRTHTQKQLTPLLRINPRRTGRKPHLQIGQHLHQQKKQTLTHLRPAKIQQTQNPQERRRTTHTNLLLRPTSLQVLPSRPQNQNIRTHQRSSRGLPPRW